MILGLALLLAALFVTGPAFQQRPTPGCLILNAEGEQVRPCRPAELEHL